MFPQSKTTPRAATLAFAAALLATPALADGFSMITLKENFRYTADMERPSTSPEFPNLINDSYDGVIGSGLRACTKDGFQILGSFTVHGDRERLEASIQKDKQAHFAGANQYVSRIKLAFQITLSSLKLTELGGTNEALGHKVIDTANRVFKNEDQTPWMVMFHPFNRTVDKGLTCTPEGV